MAKIWVGVGGTHIWRRLCNQVKIELTDLLRASTSLNSPVNVSISANFHGWTEKFLKSSEVSVEYLQLAPVVQHSRKCNPQHVYSLSVPGEAFIYIIKMYI